jgi:hypothetical protein
VLGLAIGLLPIGPVTQPAVGQSEISPPLTPAITDIEAVRAPNGRIRLRADVVPRGAEIVKVTFKYAGKRFAAKHRRLWTYSKKVPARKGDGRGDKVHFKVRACTATRCVSRSTRDAAG